MAVMNGDNGQHTLESRLEAFRRSDQERDSLIHVSLYFRYFESVINIPDHRLA